jgi:hypothetical protein
MEDQTMFTPGEEAEVLFTAHAIQGILAGNSVLADSPNDVAKKAIKLGKAVANEMFPEPKEEETTDE